MKKQQWIITGITLILFLGLLSINKQNSPTIPAFERLARNTSDQGQVAYSESIPMAVGIAEVPMEKAIDDSYLFEQTAGDISQSQDQKIIKNSYITLQVNDTRETIVRIESIAKSSKGFIQDSNISESYDGTMRGYITIKIPENKFESTIAKIRTEGLKVIEESTNTQDVTEEYTDLQARLKVAKEQELAYINLLAKADGVSELLEVQRELSNVRTKIESLEGQIQYLSNRTSYSTISVSTEEIPTVTLPTKPFQPKTIATNAMQSVVTIFQSLLEIIIWGLILSIGVVLPLSLIVWPIFKLIKRKLK